MRRRYTHLAELVADAARLFCECYWCHAEWEVPMATMRHWLQQRGDVPLTDLLRMQCQAGCGKRGVFLQWEVRVAAPVFDERVAWDGSNHRKSNRRGAGRHAARGQGKLLLQ